MKPIYYLKHLFLFFCLSNPLYAQKMQVQAEVINLEYFKESNESLGMPKADENRVVFMGNSITQSWKDYSPDFFKENGYINRGISGQTTFQMLLRFRTDVIALQPKVVVILAGINDIAQNTGYTPLEIIADNIKTMAELADYHGIKVILCSVLPAKDFPWRRGLEPAQKVVKLNQILKAYAEEKKHTYLDYYTPMEDGEGGLKVPEYTTANDLVHPNKAGYLVMESLVKESIDNVINNK